MTKYKCAGCGKIVEDPYSNYRVAKCGNCGNPCDPQTRCGCCGMFNDTYEISQETRDMLSNTWTCSCGCRNHFWYTKYSEPEPKGDDLGAALGALAFLAMIVIGGALIVAWDFGLI